MSDPEFQAVLIGGPSNGTHMMVTFPVKEIVIPTITSQGAGAEVYHLIGKTPANRFIYEHHPQPEPEEVS